MTAALRHGTLNCYRAGRCRCPECKEARRLYAISENGRHHFPAGPLVQLIRKYGAKPLSYKLQERLGGKRETHQRILTRILEGQPTVYVETADRIAVALGLHPSLIWFELWEKTGAERSRLLDPIEVRP